MTVGVLGCPTRTLQMGVTLVVVVWVVGMMP